MGKTSKKRSFSFFFLCKIHKNTPGPEGPRGVEKGLGRKRPKQKALPAGRSLPQAGPKGLSPEKEGDEEGKQSHNDLHRAPPAAGLFYDHLFVDALLERGDVGDDAHEAVALGEAGEDPDGLLKALVVQ